MYSCEGCPFHKYYAWLIPGEHHCSGLDLPPLMDDSCSLIPNYPKPRHDCPLIEDKTMYTEMRLKDKMIELFAKHDVEIVKQLCELVDSMDTASLDIETKMAMGAMKGMASMLSNPNDIIESVRKKAIKELEAKDDLQNLG